MGLSEKTLGCISVNRPGICLFFCGSRQIITKGAIIMKADHKVPMIYHNNPTECGAAVLSMVLEYYGKSVSYSLLCNKTIHKDEELGYLTSAGLIYRAAREFDLECRGFRRDVDGLLKTSLPCILHWEMNSFVVLEQADEDHFQICDPDAGRRKINREEMEQKFSNVVLTLQPTDQFLPD